MSEYTKPQIERDKIEHTKSNASNELEKMRILIKIAYQFMAELKCDQRFSSSLFSVERCKAIKNHVLLERLALTHFPLSCLMCLTWSKYLKRFFPLNFGNRRDIFWGNWNWSMSFYSISIFDGDRWPWTFCWMLGNWKSGKIRLEQECFLKIRNISQKIIQKRNWAISYE